MRLRQRSCISGAGFSAYEVEDNVLHDQKLLYSSGLLSRPTPEKNITWTQVFRISLRFKKTRDLWYVPMNER